MDYLQIGIVAIIVLTVLYFLITYLHKYFTRKKLVNTLRTAAELQKSGDISGALEKLEDNLEKFSFKDPVFASYISFLVANQKFEKAKRVIKETAEDPKEEFASVNMLGYIATIEEDFEEAEHQYQRALELDPSKKKAIYTNLAVIYAEQDKNLDKAEEMLQEVLQIEDGGNKFPAYVNLGYVQFKKGEFDSALTSEKIGLELIPKGEVHDSIRAFSHFVVGKILKAQSKPGKARSELMMARQLVRNSGFRTKIDKELNEL